MTIDDVMTREEQIRQASIEYTIKNRPMCIGGGAFSEVVDEMNRNYAFEEGAKWAYGTHGKELMYAIQKTGERTKREVISKACEWLESSLKHDLGYYRAADFVDTFRKAMEE